PICDLGTLRLTAPYTQPTRAPANAGWLSPAGTPGLSGDGKVPDDITGQAELARTHILALLTQADMSLHDVVKVTQYLRREADIPAYAEVRVRFLGEARPASMLMVVPGLGRPGVLFEIEGCPAAP